MWVATINVIMRVFKPSVTGIFCALDAFSGLWIRLLFTTFFADAERGQGGIIVFWMFMACFVGGLCAVAAGVYWCCFERTARRLKAASSSSGEGGVELSRTEQEEFKEEGPPIDSAIRLVPTQHDLQWETQKDFDGCSAGGEGSTLERPRRGPAGWVGVSGAVVECNDMRKNPLLAGGSAGAPAQHQDPRATRQEYPDHPMHRRSYPDDGSLPDSRTVSAVEERSESSIERQSALEQSRTAAKHACCSIVLLIVVAFLGRRRLRKFPFRLVEKVGVHLLLCFGHDHFTVSRGKVLFITLSLQDSE